ncbi:MAG: 1,4-dihydroxy-2-naphthoate polyprenyltransferase [Acidimicrobiales bacterium]
MSQNRWVLGARPRTLPAAVVPVLVGTAVAWGTAVPSGDGGWLNHAPAGVLVRHASVPFPWIDWINFAMALVVALALQIATNYANDYSDGKRGTDDPSRRVGPPRLVGNGLATPGEVKRAMAIAFGVALVAGGVLVVRVGWELIPVGLAAVAAGYFYTGGPRPYGYLGLGEAFVFVFFGLVATVGSTYVQLSPWTDAARRLGDVDSRLIDTTRFADLIDGQRNELLWISLGCGVMVGCFATALLVVNNLRDIPGDTVSGKRTLAVKLGDQRTRVLYVALLALPFLVLPFVAGLGGRPIGGLAFAAIMFSQAPTRTVLSGAKGPALIPVLGATGKAQMVFGVLLTAGLIASTYI